VGADAAAADDDNDDKPAEGAAAAAAPASWEETAPVAPAPGPAGEKQGLVAGAKRTRYAF
jgi:hypothetical protein